MRVLIIGAGLFGCSSAFTLAGPNMTIDLIDEQNDIMQKASLVNHNRIHLGYHYLRSIETAEQSIEGLLSFLFAFGNSVISQFPNYYAIAKEGSKTSSSQFIEFCEKVGIGYEEEFPENLMLNRSAVDSCFRVPEPVWDYDSLKQTVIKNLNKPYLNLFLNTKCNDLRILADGTFEAILSSGRKQYDIVINSTYANLNRINSMVGIPIRKLLYEDVVIPVFTYPYHQIGLTIMDGPFCSIMPHGKIPSEFLLYHVKESVVRSKIDNYKPEFELLRLDTESDSDNKIYQETSHFMPFINDALHKSYTRTIRTVYENSDDARISEIHSDNSVKNYYSILSGKVTTCIQVALEIKHRILGRSNTKRFKI